MTKIKINTPEDFFRSIPQDPYENISYRVRLHEDLAKDKVKQKDFLQLGWADPKIIFNTCLWVFDAQDLTQPNKPFILWPHQEPVVDAMHRNILAANRPENMNEMYNLAINKSRKEGASEIICKLFFVHWLMMPQMQFLMGSRKEELVDSGVVISGNRVSGDHKTLMYKVCYALVTLPLWMRPNFEKKHKFLENADNGSCIAGEATNENFGAGDRRHAILVDELGRMDPRIAMSIVDTVADTSNCVIYNSTHSLEYGIGHPFNKLITQQYGKIDVLELPWWKNPTKNNGLYLSPDYDMIEIKDIDWYRNRCPEVFNNIKSDKPFKLSVLRKEYSGTDAGDTLDEIDFIADGGDSNEGGFRSVWYDKKVESRSPRDVASNLDMRPLGAGNNVFDPVTLHRIKQRTIKPANIAGEINIIYDKDRYVLDGKFIPNFGRHRLQWWGELKGNRPDQSHNYIVACDISTGVGSSNSVAKITDVNLGEEVGIWVCPNTPAESFGDLVVALCYWVGGLDNEPYLIWEANGIGGTFGKAIKRNGYSFYYIRRDELARTKKRQNMDGWWSDNKRKYDLLSDLNVALRAGVTPDSTRKSLIVHDIETLKELETYMFLENGTMGPMDLKDDISGARDRHGDRVIPSGLTVLALEFQQKAIVTQHRAPERGSIMERVLEFEESKSKKDGFSIL